MNDRFQDLVAEASAASVDGWDFSWLDGRATEQRPSWGYARQMMQRLQRSQAALDLQTGGGEVLNEARLLPTLMVVTESWPANIAKATELLRPRGVPVVAHDDRAPLPFADNTFDLVTSRHPVGTRWNDIARVMQREGTYFSQQVGAASVFELTEHFLGPQSEETKNSRGPDKGRAGAEAAGLEVVGLQNERLEMKFYDIGAVVYFLRKVIWIVPGFSVDQHRDQIRDLHDRINTEGPFIAYSSRYLIEARKP